MMLTKIAYMYRDASNYKFRGSVFVNGILKLDMLEAYLFDEEFFVPHEVGLQHLLDMPMNEDDHYLHTFVSFEPADAGEAICTASELVTRFRNAHKRGWFSSFRYRYWPLSTEIGLNKRSKKQSIFTY